MQGLIDRQLASWPEAARRYRDLREVQTKEITIGGMPVRVQYNPARAVSTLARTDAASIAARPCFLCRENRPQQQEALPFEGCDGRRYEILVNPFPIFPEHFWAAGDSCRWKGISGCWGREQSCAPGPPSLP